MPEKNANPIRVLALAAGMSAAFFSGDIANADDTAGCPVPTEAPAASPISEVIPEDVFNHLIGWLALHTAFDLMQAYQSPPRIAFCAVGEIVDYEEKRLLVEKGLRAAFDHTNRRIYLVHPWSWDDPFDLSVLLHEMIHDIQLYSRDWSCKQAPEFEAYLLQDMWLREQGIIHPFNWIAILEFSRCPEKDKGD